MARIVLNREGAKKAAYFVADIWTTIVMMFVIMMVIVLTAKGAAWILLP